VVARQGSRPEPEDLPKIEAKLKNGLPSDTSSAADAGKPVSPADADKGNSADADKAKKSGNGG
jgi:hypothetical protein